MKKSKLNKVFAVLALSASLFYAGCSADSGSGSSDDAGTVNSGTEGSSNSADSSGSDNSGNSNGSGENKPSKNPASTGDWADDEEEGSDEVPSNEDGELAEIPDSVEGLKAFTSLSVNDIAKATLSKETQTNNVIVNATETETVIVEANSVTIGQTKYTNRLKLGGVGSKEKRSIKIYVGANQTGKLSIDCVSSSSKDSGRPLMANETKLGLAPTKASTLSASVTAGDDGYISIYAAKPETGDGGGINIYGIYWSQGNGNSATGCVDKIVDSEPQLPTIDNSAVAPSYKYGRKVGTRTNISEINTDTITNVIFVAPNGKPEGEGTKASPMDLQTAIVKVQAGGAIVLKGGTYRFASTITIADTNCGTAEARKYILPESGKAALFDFSSQPVADSSRGVALNGSYWHIYGITCYNAGDNGMYVTGKNNIVERCIFQANQDTGLQIARRSSDLSDKKDWPANNLILNCTSFDNKDDKTGENADGFASKLTCGDGNVFDGCISYANCDDGWDLYAKPATGPIGVVTIRNCVAYQNGKTTSGQNYANGDMNGFKLGGSNNSCPTPHVVENCAAFLNGKDGFTDNGNGGALQVSNCTSYGNVNSNFNFYRTFAGGVFKKLISLMGSVTPAQIDKFGGKSTECTVAAKISDSIYLTDKKKGTFNYVTAESTIYNGDKVGEATTDPYKSEMKSTAAPEVTMTVDATCRNKDGTINLNGFLETKADSKYASMGAHFGDEAENVITVDLK